MMRFIFFVFLLTLPLEATQRPKGILGFGNALFKEQDYYRAITEYKRFLHMYPTHPQKNAVEFQMGYSYLKGQKPDAALPYFQKLATQFPLKRIGQDAQFALAQTLFESKQYDFAIGEWRTFQTQFPKHPLSDAAAYQMAWAYFLQEKIQEAKQELISNRHPKTLAFSQEINQWQNLPSRPPFLAGTFSAMLPGLGQWYVGRFWDGMAALVVNGMFGYGIYRTWVNEYYVSFGILTFLASGFYGGNIYSAVNSAHKYNQNIKNTNWQRLQNQYGLNLNWTGTALTVSWE